MIVSTPLLRCLWVFRVNIPVFWLQSVVWKSTVYKHGDAANRWHYAWQIERVPNVSVCNRAEMKQSLYWHGQTLRVPRVWGSQISRQWAHEGGKPLSPRVGRLYPPFMVDSSWNVTAHDAREGKWRGNWRMEWVASTLQTTSEHSVSSITTADAHTSAASSRMNWRPPPI